MTVDFNPLNEEFIICTSVDIRYISIFTGEQKKVLQGISGSGSDISFFFQDINHKRFFIGDEAGDIRNYLANSGKMNDEYLNISDWI